MLPRNPPTDPQERERYEVACDEARKKRIEEAEHHRLVELDRQIMMCDDDLELRGLLRSASRACWRRP